MSKSLLKSRFFMLHPRTNPGKIEHLEALHQEYVAYVRICIQLMLSNRRLNLARSEKQAFFPRAEKLTSQIEKNARDHAIEIVSGWARSKYVVRMKGLISKMNREGQLSAEQAKALHSIGKYLKGTSGSEFDCYWKLLDEQGGRKPEVGYSLPMRLSQETARLEDPKEDGAILADLWLRVSSLEFRKSLWLPLVGNPYVSASAQVSRGILARKTKTGAWRFEAVETCKWVVLEPQDLPPDAPRLGVDVGLNVLAATSDGDLHGREFKPKFDRRYKQIKDLRANRQRQGLRENSPRLAALESKLSGMIKTETGRIANLLVRGHPDTVFVLEDLDLSGCRGQKRFAYRALQRALSAKAPVEVVNPAYTSQECPSCGYVSRSNRSGTSFSCRSCGRKAHADWVGASGVLRRSQDNDIGRGDHPRTVKATLRRRYLLRRDSPARSSSTEPSPLGRSLTTGALASAGTGTGSNLVPSACRG